MRAPFKKFVTYITRENRALVFTFAFLFAFSLASYAFATYPATPFAPGDTVDPSCAPGDVGAPNCFVQIGGISGSGSTNEVAIWDSSGNLTSNGNFLYNPTSGNFEAGDGTTYNIQVRPTAKTISLLGSAGAEGLMYIGTGSGALIGAIKGLVLDVSAGDYILGNGNTLGTNLALDDAASKVQIFSEGDTVLKLDKDRGLYSIGSTQSVSVVASTTISFIAVPHTIHDSAGTLGSFKAGMFISVKGTISGFNDGTYEIATASSTDLVLVSGLTVDQPAGTAITITTNHTNLSIDDSLRTTAVTARNFSVTDAFSKKFLFISADTGIYQIGDIGASGNSTKVTVDDGAQTTTVTGNLTITGSLGTVTTGCVITGTDITCPSDQRLKTNVTDLPSTLEQISKLRPVSFTWINPKSSQTPTLGFIAQEMQQVFPEFVNKAGDYLGINYAGLVVPAIKGIQELNLKVELLSSLDSERDGSLASLFVRYLQNAAVSIREATIATLRIGGQVCADDVCITKDQFKQLLLQAGGSVQTPAPAPEPVPEPVVEPDIPPETTDTSSTEIPPDEPVQTPVEEPVPPTVEAQ